MKLSTYVTPRRALIGIVLLVAAVAGVWLLQTMGAVFNPERIRALLVPLGWWGPLALVVALAGVLVAPIIPATVFQIGAGLAFGPLPGLGYALLGDALGASIGFGVARRWGPALMARLSPAKRETLGRLTRRMTWRAVLLLRLLPGPAYPLISFAAGSSSLRFGTFLLASVLGSAPTLALLALAGDLVTSSPALAFGLVVVIVGGLALAGRVLGGPAQETNDQPASHAPQPHKPN